MFDIGWTELLFIAVVAIIVVGPKDLPRALRAVGHWTGKARRMAGDFQRQFNEAIREAELDDVKKHVTDMKKQVADLGKIDPVGDIRKEMAKTEAGLRSDLDKATGATGATRGDGKAPAAAAPDLSEATPGEPPAPAPAEPPAAAAAPVTAAGDLKP